jgi:hypothetical protein
MKYQNEDLAKLSDIETELEDIKSFLIFRYRDDKLIDVSLGVNWEMFKRYFPEVKKKAFIELLDYFNNNLEAVQEVICK